MVSLKKIIGILLAISVMVLMISVQGFSQKQLVFDEAGLFVQSELAQLQIIAEELSLEYNMDIVITTTNDAEGKSSREYADDYFDYGGFGVGADYSGILFLMDMDNREVYISTSGEGIRYLTDQRIESILDDVFDGGLTEGDYFGASSAFISSTKFYLQQGIPEDQYSEDEGDIKENNLTITEAIASILGSLGIGGGFYGSIKSKYKVRNPGNPFSYRSNSIVNLADTNDKLLDSNVTSRIIPKPPTGTGSSGGRSTTHRSSSGRTHGGGGRKF